MPSPTRPSRPATPAAVNAGTNAAAVGQGSGVMALLFYLGLAGELAVSIGAAWIWVAGVLGRWARDSEHARKESGMSPNLLLRLIGALGCVLLFAACASDLKVGPGPYGWFQLQYSFAKQANLDVSTPMGSVCVGCLELEEDLATSEPAPPE